MFLIGGGGIAFLYFRSLTWAIIYGLIATSFIPYLTVLKYKRVYKNLLEDFSEIPKSNSSTKLTEEEIDIIRKELEAGSKPSEISKKYNIPRLAIIDFKRGKSFASQTPKTEKFLGGEKLKKCEVLEIISLYKKGYDFEQLSIKFNVCKDTIKNIIYKKTWKSLTKDIDI